MSNKNHQDAQTPTSSPMREDTPAGVPPAGRIRPKDLPELIGLTTEWTLIVIFFVIMTLVVAPWK